MNILPKKRWHVRTKDNIARVRRDEAEALEKEKEIQHRAKLAKQEARIDILRQKVRSTTVPEEKIEKCDKDGNIFTNSGNINFFKEIEAGLQGGSSIKKDEERKEKEAYEKKIGLLTQLGQNSMELSGGKHWYEDKSHFTFYKDIETDNKEVGLKHKMAIDPLNEILKHTSGTLDVHTNSKNLSVPNHISSVSMPLKKHKKKKYKHRKDKKSIVSLKKKLKKKHKKSKSHEVSSRDNEDELLRINILKKLRRERLEREAKEKLRAERLVAGKDPDLIDVHPDNAPYRQSYNSQFNPNFAKQNRKNV